jgi:serine protease
MTGRRLTLVSLAAALVASLFQATGRTQAPPRFDVLRGVGQPAIEQNITLVPRRLPGSLEVRARDAMRQRGDRPGRAGGRYAPGRLIVKFRDGVSDADRRAALAGVLSGPVVRPRGESADFDVVDTARGADLETAADALAARADVEYAQPAYRWTMEFTPNDPFFTRLQWNLPLIDLERAWDIQPDAGSAITVAVIDSGVAFTNATITADLPAFTFDGAFYPALGHVTIPYAAATQLARFVSPRDFIWGGDTPLDFDGHGTHVSGTIGQTTNDGIGTAGVAFNVKLMPVKVVDSIWDDLFGAPNAATDDVVAQGIRYAVDNGAKVLNMSIGRDGPSAPVIEDAIRYAVGKGAFVAIAAGNGFADGNPTEVIAEIASHVDGAVSVAAIDRVKEHAFYSTTGDYVELSAPGGGGGSQDNGYVWQQTFNYNFTDTYLLPPAQYGAPRFDIFAYVGYIGTSMATPHVSGLAAMIMQQGITDPAAVESVLERFATDLGTPGRDSTYGYGLVDARAVLRGLGVAR